MLVIIEAISTLLTLHSQCFGVDSPAAPIVHELDRKFEHWESHLPSEFRNDGRNDYFGGVSDGATLEDATTLARQRYTLTTWYLFCRMKLHLTFVTSQDAPHFLGAFDHPMTRKRSRSICISLAIELLQLQCEAHDATSRYRVGQAGKEALTVGSNWFFEGCFSLFDAAVTLVSVLTLHAPLERPSDAEGILNRAVLVLTQVAREEGRDTGNIARKAVDALTALMQEPGWRSTRDGSAATPPMSAGISQMTAVPQQVSFSGLYNPPSPYDPALSMYDWYSDSSSSNGHDYGLPAQLNVSAVRNIDDPSRFVMDLMTFEESKIRY